MSEARPPSPTRDRFRASIATGLLAALGAGGLDLVFSLWLESPSGLRSASNLLLTFAASIALAFAAWLAAFLLLKVLLRNHPRPLALPITGALLIAVLLHGVFLTLAPGTPAGRAASPQLLLDRTPPARQPVSPPAVPRVIVLSIDTLRADALEVLRSPRDSGSTSGCAGRGFALFLPGVFPASWTLPAMASVMTGVAPPVHGALHLRSRVPDRLPTLAEVLRHAGYRTAAFVASTVLGPQANLAQGFDEYHAWPGPWLGHSFGATLLTARLLRFRQEEAPPPVLADAVRGWLREHREEPFFLWVHAFDPHAPYGPPLPYLQGRTPPPGLRFRFEGWDEEAIRAGTWVPTAAERDWIRQLYEAEIRWTDNSVGRLVAELKRLGLYDDALILVVSDHGEEFWEHGSYGHGHTLYEELLRVPLLVKLPGSARRERITTPVSTASLFATVLDACTVPFPSGHPAAGSLLANTQVTQHLLQGLNRYEDRRGVLFGLFGGFKYIRWTMSGREELYDLERDPGEAVDLSSSAPSDLAEGRRLLADLEAEARSARLRLRLPEGEASELDSRTLERLRSLGYAQ